MKTLSVVRLVDLESIHRVKKSLSGCVLVRLTFFNAQTEKHKPARTKRANKPTRTMATCCPTSILPVPGVEYAPRGSFVHYRAGSGSGRHVLFVPDINLAPLRSVQTACERFERR